MICYAGGTIWAFVLKAAKLQVESREKNLNISYNVTNGKILGVINDNGTNRGSWNNFIKQNQTHWIEVVL